MLEIGQEWILYTTPFRMTEVAAAPAGGEIIPNVVSLYAKDNGSGVSTLCYTNDAGTEICLPTVGPIVTGSGTANRLVKWTGTSTIGDFVPTAGSVIFAGVSGIGQEDNANFFWDDTNNRLGIGTASPGVPLDVLVTATADPAIKARSASSTALSIAAINSAGSARLFAAGGTDDFITGAAAGDSGLQWSAAKKFWLGLGNNTPRFVIGTAGEWGVGASSFGAANSIFTSNGTGAAPSWNSTLIVTTVTASGLTQGSVVFAGVGGILSQDNANFFWDDTNNRLGLGTTAPAFTLDARGAATVLIAHRASADANGPNIAQAKARGTPGSEAATQSGDTLGFFSFGGHDGTAFRYNSAIVGSFAGSLWSGTNRESYLTLETTPNASATRAERMRVFASGAVGIGTTTDVSGSISLAVGSGTHQGAGLDVSSNSSTGGGDWVAWFRRQSTANPCESTIRHQHFSGGAVVTQPIIAGIASRGTVASPTTLAADDFLLILDGRGYDGSATNWNEYAVGFSDTSAQIAMKAAEAWSGTAHGSYIKMSTVKKAATSPVEHFRINDQGFIGHSTGTTAQGDPFATFVGVADGLDYSVVWDSFSAGSSAALIGRRSRGSVASPTHALNGDTLFTFQARGQYDSTVGHMSGPTAGIDFVTTEDFSSTAQGTEIRLNVTPNTTAAEITAFAIRNDGQLNNRVSGNETTGGGTASLGANSPAVTNTAPYKWLKVVTQDGSQGYIPIWK